MDTKAQKSIEVFCCYAREDRLLLLELKTHLTPLQREGLITLWTDTDIDAGVEWEKEIHRHLNSAQVILLLISPDFIASDYCYSIEMQRAIERYQAGEVSIIPVILRPVSWQEAPFGKIQALPTDAKPVTSWSSREDALYDVVKGIRKAVMKLKGESLSGSSVTPSSSVPPQTTTAPIKEQARPREDHQPTGDSLVTIFQGPSLREQEYDIEKLDPEDVWENIQQKNIPSSLHVLEESVSSRINSTWLPGLACGFGGGLGLFLIGSQVYEWIFSPSYHPLLFVNSGFTTLCLVAVIVGIIFGGRWAKDAPTHTLVLMPDGLIHFTGNTPELIGYKVIRKIRFVPSDNNLRFDPFPLTNDPKIARLSYNGTIDINRYNESPQDIERRVTEAFAKFQGHHPAVKLSISGQLATITYDGPLTISAKSITMHWGYNNWNDITDTSMTRDPTGTWQAIITIPSSATVLNMAFCKQRGKKTKIWDNYDGSDYNLSISSS